MPNQSSQHTPQPTPYKVDALLAPNRSQTSQSSAQIDHPIRLNATAIADAILGVIENASIILKPTATGYEILASGSKAQIDAKIDSDQLPDPTMELTLRDRIIMPALVNAHTHLDLTHIGPIAHDPADGFVKWVDIIRSERKTDDAEIRQAVRLGIQASLAGGTIAVGDIAGAPNGRLTDAPALELAQSPMSGVSYLEFFGIGKSAAAAIQKISHYLTNTYPQSVLALQDTGVHIGLQPHAPNTVDLSVYHWAAAAAALRGMPLSTHLAETIEERWFIGEGIGPQRELLERLGVWDNSILDHIAKDNHPVAHLYDVLNESPFLVAHVNDATDAAIAQLVSTNTAVAYCPRASAYFGADKHFGPHRYQDMLAAGVHVCLGTDSIVNLDTRDRISILDEMRFLSRRDGTDATTLIMMATTNGGSALSLDESSFTFTPGTQPLGLISIPIKPGHSEVWEGAMQSDEPSEWVFLQHK